jgi:hypothetical protein
MYIYIYVCMYVCMYVRVRACPYIGASCRIGDGGAMLQAGRTRARVPMRSLNFSNLPNPSIPTLALRFTQPLTEMNTRRSFWG